MLLWALLASGRKKGTPTSPMTAMQSGAIETEASMDGQPQARHQEGNDARPAEEQGHGLAAGLLQPRPHSAVSPDRRQPNG